MCVQDSHQPSSSKKILERPSSNSTSRHVNEKAGLRMLARWWAGGLAGWRAVTCRGWSNSTSRHVDEQTGARVRCVVPRGTMCFSARHLFLPSSLLASLLVFFVPSLPACLPASCLPFSLFLSFLSCPRQGACQKRSRVHFLQKHLSHCRPNGRWSHNNFFW